MTPKQKTLAALLARGRGAPGAPRDPFFANVVYLLHGEGPNTSTTITDSSPYARTFTATGGAQLTTTSPIVGAASIALPNVTGNFISTPHATELNVDATALTIEFAYRPTTLPTITAGREFDTLFSKGSVSSGMWVFLFVTGQTFYWRNGAGAELVTPVAHGMTAGVNYRWRLVKNGTNYYVYRDGTLITSGSGGVVTTNSLATIFGAADASATHAANGVFDEIRGTYGIARSTGPSYVIEPGPFPDAGP